MIVGNKNSVWKTEIDPELIINGDFSEGSNGWNDIISPTISGVDNINYAIEAGQLKSIGASTQSRAIFNTQTSKCKYNNSYRVSFEITSSTANFGVRFCITSELGTSFVNVSSYLGVGMHIIDIPANTYTYDYTIGFYRFSSHIGDQYIDNVSVLKI